MTSRDNRPDEMPEGLSLAGLADASPAILYVEDLLAGRLVYVSAAAERLLGYTPAELLALGPEFEGRLLHPADRARLGPLADAFAPDRGDGPVNRELRVRHKAGHWLWFATQDRVYRRADDGRPHLIIGSALDVTELKATAAALREREEQYQRIIDASPLGLHRYRLEADGRLVFEGGNPAADRILGLTHADFVGRTIEDAFPPLRETDIPTRYRQVAATGEPWQWQHVAYEDDRIQGAFEVYAFQTAPREMAAAFLEISDRKQAEETRRRLERQLEQAAKMEAVGRLAGGVAHDFNNLLTAIQGYAELAAAACLPGTSLAADVAEVLKTTERATRLTRQLLAFSRQQAAEPRPVELNGVVRDIARMLERLVGETITLECRLDPAAGQVLADRGQLDQIIINLAVNARDAMPEGGRLTLVTSAVTVDDEFATTRPALQPGPYLRLQVGDTGCGMDALTLSHAFEPFFTTKEAGQGTGLGLATVYGLVRQARGHIEVHSQPGQGARFDIYLPRLTAAELAEEASPATVARAPEGGTILLVEDDPAVRRLTLRALRRHGYRVIEAEGPGLALELVRAGTTFELLLTDVVMPELSGPELAAELRRQGYRFGLVYMSGYPYDVVARERLLDADAPWLSKPFSVQDLLATVAGALAEAAQGDSQNERQ